MLAFKKNNAFEKRKSFAAKVAAQYVNKVPIIVEISPKSSSANETEIKLARNKYIVGKESLISELLHHIRGNIQPISSVTAVFIFIMTPSNTQILCTISSTIDEIYNKYKHDDDILYLVVALENTFG